MQEGPLDIGHLSSWSGNSVRYPGLAHGWPGHAWVCCQLLASGLMQDTRDTVTKGILHRLEKGVRNTHTTHKFVSPLIGFGAIPLIAASISRYHPKGHELLVNSLRHWEYLCERSPIPDVMLGHAGALLGCAEIERILPGQIRPHLLKLLLKKCISLIEQILTERPKRPMYLGFSHGLAGILLALETARTVFELPVNGELIARCKKIVWQERLEAEGRACAWPARLGETKVGIHGWCHGGPGIGLAMLCCYRLTNDRAYWHMAQRALHGTYLFSTDTNNTSFCCGSVGRSHILIEAYRQTGDTYWLQKARYIAAKGNNKSIQHANHKRGFLKGRLGIQYLQWRLAYPDLLPMPALGILSTNSLASSLKKVNPD